MTMTVKRVVKADNNIDKPDNKNSAICDKPMMNICNNNQNTDECMIDTRGNQ